MNSKMVSIVIGLIFVAVGILGFIPNPIIANSPDAIFHADTVHSMVHIISGLLFLISGFAFPASSRTVLILFGIVYFLIGILGFINRGGDGMNKVLGFLHVNKADNFLHVG